MKGLANTFQPQFPFKGIVAAMAQMGFNPRTLFANNEPGVWYDPSDIKLDWRRNLLTSSEVFTGIGYLERASITGNNFFAPNGSMTASKLVENTSYGTHYHRRPNVQDGVKTLSVFAKAAERSWLALGTNWAVENGAYFDLINGTVGTVVGSTVAGMQNVGGGWWRCWITTNWSSASTETYADIIIANGNNGQSYTGDGFSGVYIWGAQLEVGSTATPYQRITDGIQDYYAVQALPVLYQDAVGTTPVTAVEQPVGLMLDKSKGLVLGPELVANGTFDVDTTGWAGANLGTIAAVNGELELTNGGAAFGRAVSPVATVAGRTYAVSVTVRSSATHGVNFGAGTVIGNTNLVTVGGTHATNTTKTFAFVAAGATTYLTGTITTATAGLTAYFDNISVRELPGNHAYQTTATSRPVLSARYNLLTKTEQFDDAVWTKQGGFVAITPNAALAPNGTMTADLAVWSGFGSLYQGPIAGVAGVIYVARVWVKGESGKTISVWFDTGTLSVNRQRYLLTGEWQEIVLQSTYNGTGGINLAVRKDNSLDTASEILVWGADLRVANDGANLPPYQRVNTATDYDTVGFPHYLRFDGVDDWLVTPTITPGTDKVQVFAGVRKLSDAATGIVLETSTSMSLNNGAISLITAGSSGAHEYAYGSSGTSQQYVTTTSASFNAPHTGVLTGTADISGDRAAMRINGTQAASSTADQGTGNYLAYPLYIGRRGGTTFPFNGRLYSLIVRFGSNLPIATIEKTEKYVNTKTRAY